MLDTLYFAKAAAVILGSYLLGCLATGYYLVRWRTGQDLRSVGSGSTGGTNAGRVLGRWGLVLTMLVDMLKGAIVILAARYFRLEPWAVALAAAAVVAGHVFPFHLGFHGGRGLSPALGAMLIYDAELIALVVGLTGLLWILSRRTTLSLMLVVATSPLLALALRRAPAEVWGVIPVVLIVVMAHRQKIGAEFAAARGLRG